MAEHNFCQKYKSGEPKIRAVWEEAMRESLSQADAASQESILNGICTAMRESINSLYESLRIEVRINAPSRKQATPPPKEETLIQQRNRMFWEAHQLTDEPIPDIAKRVQEELEPERKPSYSNSLVRAGALIHHEEHHKEKEFKERRKGRIKGR